MDTQTLCQSCQVPLAGGAVRGLCPACLMKVALATGTVDGPDQPGFTPPAIEELAPKFPQLEIIELIGRGGMGAVYKARQKQLDRIVALKILPPGIGEDAAFAERFAREAKALARLNHPGIVTIHDFGKVGSQPSAIAPQPNLYYFLMEFVDGVNLRQLLANGRVAPREALAIVPQICDALQYAHDQGIVHRDIKPENILLDRRGRVKVADFGLAKLVGTQPLAPDLSHPTSTGEGGASSSGESMADLTAAGKIMGTPHYMAPEQTERPAEVDHRADIYALGVVFYQLLTGELPGRRLEPPSKKVQIDVRLDEVVLRTLERKPELRYQQASVLKTQIETIASIPPVSAIKSPQRNSTGKMLAIGCGVVALLGLILVLSRHLPAEAETASAPPVSANRPLSRVSASSSAREQQVQIPGVEAGSWEQREPAPLLGRATEVAWTGTELIVFGGTGMGTTFGDGARYDLAANSWRPLPQEGAPGSRYCFPAVWTGREFIVWGGYGGTNGQDIMYDDGARFEPSSNTWKPLSNENAPSARFVHSAVWTGQEMLVWGGYTDLATFYDGCHADAHLNTGARYNPATDSWREISTRGAPSKRIGHVAIWTGKEMLIWGGANASKTLRDGGLYNPRTDTWRTLNVEGAPSTRGGAAAVWTGRELIVWGGERHQEYFVDGARFNPETNEWKPISAKQAPRGRVLAQAVWTGNEMVLWGGVNDEDTASTSDPSRYLNTGARYNPATDAWTSITTADAPSGRLTSAVWTGKGLLLWGGYNNQHLNETWFLRAEF